MLNSLVLDWLVSDWLVPDWLGIVWHVFGCHLFTSFRTASLAAGCLSGWLVVGRHAASGQLSVFL